MGARAAERPDTLRSLYASEPAVHACMSGDAGCDSGLLMEKSLTLIRPLQVGPGVFLRVGTRVRTWFAGAATPLAKDMGTRFNAAKSPGGRLLLFAEGTLQLPEGSHLAVRVGTFDRLDRVDLTSATPGILASATDTTRVFQAHVWGKLTVGRLALHTAGTRLEERSEGLTLKAPFQTDFLGRGRITTDITVGPEGAWQTQGGEAALSLTVERGGLGAFAFQSFSLRKPDGPSPWSAGVRVLFPGMKAHIDGDLLFQDGAFQHVRFDTRPCLPLAATGLQLGRLKGTLAQGSRGPAFKGAWEIYGGATQGGPLRLALASPDGPGVTWDRSGLRGSASLRVSRSTPSTPPEGSSARRCIWHAMDMAPSAAWPQRVGLVNLSFDWAQASYLLQGAEGPLTFGRDASLGVSQPLRLFRGRLSYSGPGHLHFPGSHKLLAGDTVSDAHVTIHVDTGAPEKNLMTGWTSLRGSVAGLRVHTDTGVVTPFGVDSELARKSRMRATPDFAASDSQRKTDLKAARLVDDPTVNQLRKRAGPPRPRVQRIAFGIRELVAPEQTTLVRFEASSLLSPYARMNRARSLLRTEYTSPEAYEAALASPTARFMRPIYGPPLVLSPSLWGQTALRLKTAGPGLGRLPAAVPATVWGAWGLRSNLGCAGHYGVRGVFGAGGPRDAVAGADQRAYCWLGTRAHLGASVADIFDYPVGGRGDGGVDRESLGAGSVERPYKYNMMPGLSLKSCGDDRAPGVLDCDPYWVAQGVSCELQQAYVGATKVGSCAPVLHEYRPLSVEKKVVHFDEAQNFGTLRADLRSGARSKDGGLTLPAGRRALIQCPAALISDVLAGRPSRLACQRPGQMCRARVDVAHGGVPSLGPAFACSNGAWEAVGLSPLEAAGFPKACRDGGAWDATLRRTGDRFIGTEEVKAQVQGSCDLVGSTPRYEGLGWGWWGAIPNAYCSLKPSGPTKGPAGGLTLPAAMAERAFQACSHPWAISQALRDWSQQLEACPNLSSAKGTADFRACDLKSTVGVPVRLVAWDKSGVIYAWERMELVGARADAASPAGTRFSASYASHRGVRPENLPEEAHVGDLNEAACRARCDALGEVCLGYSREGAGVSACQLATRAAYPQGLTLATLQSASGEHYMTRLKRQPQLFPTLNVGDTGPCGKELGGDAPCNGASRHTFALRPTRQTLQGWTGSLPTHGAKGPSDQLRQILKHAPLLLDPADRNREGLRVIALTDAELAGDKARFHFATQPLNQGPELAVKVRVDPGTRQLHIQATVPKELQANTHVRVFVDDDAHGYNGRLIDTLPLSEGLARTLTWKAEPFAKNLNHRYRFYATIAHEDPARHRASPIRRSPYAANAVQASPAISGHISLGDAGRGEPHCVHVALAGETCEAIAARHRVKAKDLMFKSGDRLQGCVTSTLQPGTRLAYPGSCGVQVFLDLNQDGALQPATEPSTFTDGRGRFAFEDVSQHGATLLGVVLPTGFHSREDFAASFSIETGRQLQGAHASTAQHVESLSACLDLCHPLASESGPVGERRALSRDGKECGGVNFEAEGGGGRCVLHRVPRDARSLRRDRRRSPGTLHVRRKGHLRVIHRRVRYQGQPVQVPRLVLHPIS